MTDTIESNDKMSDIKDVLFEATKFLKQYGYDKIVESDKFWSYTLSFISLKNGYAIEFELDFREGDVFVLITTLEGHKLPEGYYMSNGKRVRIHIEHYLENIKIRSKKVHEIFELHRANEVDLNHKMILLIKAYSMLIKENLGHIGE